MARFRLKRKTYSIAGALFGAKNFKAMSSGVKALADGGTKNLNGLQRAWEGTKGVAKTAGTLGATSALGAGAVAYKAGGGDLISGGEKSAKEMDFS